MKHVALAVLATTVGLTGCSSIGGFAGAIAGAASGTFTSNPAVGVGVGIAVKAATDSAVQKVFRDMQSDEQSRIAAIAGTLAPGDRQPWEIHHRLPFSDEHGELEVVGAIDNALAPCKTVIFSVAGAKAKGSDRAWFMTQVCRQPTGQWAWATAEPAVGRWGTLQ